MVGPDRVSGSIMFLRAILTAAVLAVTLGAASPSRAEFHVCNKSDERASVSIGYKHAEQGWTSEGWWVVPIGECKRILLGDLKNRYYYIYATGHKGGAWSGQKRDQKGGFFCITQAEIHLPQPRLREEQHHRLREEEAADKQFRIVDTGDSRDFTYNLTDGNEPAVAARPEPRTPEPATAPPAAQVPRPSTPAATPVLPVVPSTASGQKRVALVIGNARYRSTSEFANPRRDAEAVAAALRRVGFHSVQVEADLPRDKLIDTLRRFAREADTADWAMVYYSGHGIEIGGMNYLLPVDATLETDRDAQFEAVALDQVLGAVEGARKLRLVVLDACRDNPFLRKMKRTYASRSVGHGLARIEPEGGTLVAYAAKHGQVALDGAEGTNSPFAASLVKRLPTPGIEINKLFRLVRDDVMAATGRKQEPFVYGSLPGEEFFFVASQ
jgi:uncharacterized membrane protein